MLAFDCAGPIDLEAAKAAGAGAVGLYLGGNLTTKAAEVARSLDIGLWSFWERWASDPNGGAPQGRLDAAEACSLAAGVGQPARSPIYMPNDQIVNDLAATLAYFKAAAVEITSRGRIPGFYGQTSIYEQVRPYGYNYFVHAPDGTAPPYPLADIVQRVAPQKQIGGVTVDVDEVQSLDYGGWNQGGIVYTPTDPKGGGFQVLTVTMPLVVEGQQGKPVEQLQRLLNGHGHSLTVDGDYGPATAKAVEAFQANYGITPASHFGSESWHAAGWGEK